MRRLCGWNTVPGLIIAIASIALVLALLRVENGWGVLIFPGGPVVGAIFHRKMGGRGILGGAIGGLLGFSGFVIGVYVWYRLFPDPNLTDYLGPGLALLAAAVYGSMIGSFVGVVVWIIALCIANPPTKKSVIDEV